MVLFKKMFANQLSKSYVWRNVVHQRARWTLGVQGLVRVLASFSGKRFYSPYASLW